MSRITSPEVENPEKNFWKIFGKKKNQKSKKIFKIFFQDFFTFQQLILGMGVVYLG